MDGTTASCARSSSPEWARHAIWYQIMLDRFRSGSQQNNPPQIRPWTSDWFTPSPWEQAISDNFYDFVFGRLYGGDLDGLIEKLPYLEDLGINAIYLNPVFAARTHHKYDATNYVHIDKYFGLNGNDDELMAREDLLDPSTWRWTDSDKRFLDFLNAAHERHFRVIIDGVFNHVGTHHPAYQDLIQNGQASRFADWFDVHSWDPLQVHGWAGFSELPAFRKSDRGLVSATAHEHIFHITRRWMDPDNDGDPADGIDGWRLDVPSEIPMPFWAEWRDLVKSINPDAYLTGEIWTRADAWLDGNHFDAVMNYEFARSAVDWIINRASKASASQIDERLRTLREAYGWDVSLVQQNLLDSHDTARIVSMARNPDRDYEHGHRAQNDPTYDNGKPEPSEYRRVRLAVALQMTYIGAPMVYYGDEAGMWGGDDPTNRKPMIWEDLYPYESPNENFVMVEHRDFYRAAIHLRRAHAALRTGGYETLLINDDDDVWVYRRWNDNEQLIVALNASTERRTFTLSLPEGMPTHYRTVLGKHGDVSTEDGQLTLSVPHVAGVVLLGT